MRTAVEYDAILLLSFGGPEGPDDVMPFLRRVTAGRGVPDERLEEVAEHYHHYGGVSPINDQNRALLEVLRPALDAVGLDLPLYWGNRNWHPLLEDTVARMRDEGVRRALVFATSATGSYSGCRQYREDIARARGHVGDDAPELVKLRHFYDHPRYVRAHADGLRAALDSLPAEHRDTARLVFTAHSIPSVMDEQAGLGWTDSGHLYSRQQHETARLVAETVRGPGAEFDLVWQSRSGPPQVPWLVPDINDHLEALAADGVRAVVVAPTGFVSDHLEVLWDLDEEARETAGKLGIAFARAATPGTHPEFVTMIRELIEERTAGRDPVGESPLGRTGIDCPLGCCPAPRRPAASGARPGS